MRTPLGLVGALAVFSLTACAGLHSPPGANGPGSGGMAAGTGGTGGSGTGGSGTGGITFIGGSGGTHGFCGDGAVQMALGEVCDDGNIKSGDGCSGDCKTVEKDYACPQAGVPCTYLVRCGDGVLGGIEQCDPPHPGAGCAADCRLEHGFVCDPPPTPPAPSVPSACHATICGDGVKEGTEACDDHAAIDGDGCSSTCALEPDCSSGTCVSKCGDGLKLAPEACDDGNTVDGDGCTHDCQIEAGFTCMDSTASLQASLNLAVTFRDFISFPEGDGVRHPDFEADFAGMDVTTGLVQAALDGDGKPVMDGRCAAAGVSAQCPYGQQLTSVANFGQWYHDVSGVNLPIPSALLLPQRAGGAYVFDSGGNGFYPIDGKGWTATSPAREAVEMADPTVNDGGYHDFGFTTEVRYFFQYRGGETLAFSGDDDLWIFLNRRLALDLGGLHPRTERSISIDASAAALGLTAGGIYEIALFHAERHSAGSNFKLTLTGFAPTSSTCRSACGDGVRAANEQCDDGNNVDGDGCSHACRIEIGQTAPRPSRPVPPS